jgi:serine/threonine protein phosphatase PrpC
VGDARAGRANEDSLFALTLTAVANSVASPTLGLYIVADGLGGHLDGEVASRTACQVISSYLLELLGWPAWEDILPTADAVLETIEQAIQDANEHIYDLAAERECNMGTTLVLALVINDRVYIANVGDSRAYFWGRDGLRQITQDHSHVFTLYKNGLIEEDEIYAHPRRNEIFRSLGAADAVEVDFFQVSLTPGDLLLLCSDGLWEMLHSEGIADVLLMNLGDPQVTCDELVNSANAAGGDDNISVVAVRAGA